MNETMQNAPIAPELDKLSNRNLISFSVGTIGRDFVYGLFNSFLLSYILFTKDLSDAQFTAISFIIIGARLFDAFNDPFMGGLVENTRSKWGKFKPWQLIGAVLTGGVVTAAFSTNLQGWGFIGFIACIYFLFSISFTMNDISYWGMMPSLSRNEKDRGKLMSFSQLCASAGGALVGILVPALTAGGLAIGGSAVNGFRYVAVIASAVMILFQLVTIFGVKEKPLSRDVMKKERMTIKQMFSIIVKNDQLMWCALILLLFSIGTNVVGAGLSMTYIYFEFKYDGVLLTVFGILFAVTSTLFTLLYPLLSKKFGRDKLFASSAFAIIIGYALMLLFGLVIPSNPWYLKFGFLMLANGIVGYGQGAFYMIMVISIANTVEYNEWKTGERDEGLIFSIRPFTAKMSSAITQFFVMLIYLMVGVLNYTNRIAALENDAAAKNITDSEKLNAIENLLSGVPEASKIALLVCMCVIPILFVTAAFIIYKKKCFLTEKKHLEIVNELHLRHVEQYDEESGIDNAGAVVGATGNIGLPIEPATNLEPAEDVTQTDKESQ